MRHCCGWFEEARDRGPRGARPDGKGGYFVTLPHGVVDRLNYLREPGQSYSEVILRSAKAE